jgi:hypothetical protein
MGQAEPGAIREDPKMGELALEAARLVVLARERPEREVDYSAARSLLMAGQRSSALRRFLSVVLRGAGPHFVEAAREVSEELASLVEPALVDRLPGVDLSSLPRETQDPIQQGVALHLLRTGQADAAGRILRSIRQGAGPRYLEAVIALHRGDRPAAARLFLVAPEVASRSEDSEVVDLATLALARLEAERGAWDRATPRYAAIPYGSPHFFRARQELAWVRLQAGDPAGALSESAVLSAPAMKKYYRPDREVVEAAALLGLCRGAEARAQALAGGKRLGAAARHLAVFLRPVPDVRLYYLEAMASAAGRSGALSPEQVSVLLADASFRRAFTVVRQLQRERALLADPGAAALRRVLATELDERLVSAQRLAGQTASRILEGMLREIRELRQRGEEILFEVEGRGEEQESKHRGGKDGRGWPRARSAAAGRQETWPMRGEFWSDEVPFLRVPMVSSCPRGARSQ